MSLSRAHVCCGPHGMPQAAGSLPPLPSLPPSAQLPLPQILSLPRASELSTISLIIISNIPVLIFATMWVLSSTLFFPDHFVRFDHVAQLVLVKTLICHENHLSWSSFFSHSFLHEFFFLLLKLLLLQYLSLPAALFNQYVFLGDSHGVCNSQFKWIGRR